MGKIYTKKRDSKICIKIAVKIPKNKMVLNSKYVLQKYSKM